MSLRCCMIRSASVMLGECSAFRDRSRRRNSCRAWISAALIPRIGVSCIPAKRKDDVNNLAWSVQNSQTCGGILSPIVGKNGYALKNSADMVSSLSNSTLQEEYILVLFDVTALFAKVPVDKSVEIIHNKLESDQPITPHISMTAAMSETYNSCV